MPQDPPVSVKAALRCGDRWVVVRNDRGEWELPGGRIDEEDQDLRAVVRRECREELAIEVQVGDLIDACLFEVVPGKRVTIVAFLATADDLAKSDIQLSHEHTEFVLVTTAEVTDLDLAEGYRSVLVRAAALLSAKDEPDG